MKSQNGNLQFTVTEDSRSICILTSEFNRNWFFKCLNINSTVQLSFLLLSLYICFHQKPQECFQKYTEVPWWKITLFSVQLLIFMGHISTSNLSLSNIYPRIQLLHLRQKTKSNFDKYLKYIGLNLFNKYAFDHLSCNRHCPRAKHAGMNRGDTLLSPAELNLVFSVQSSELEVIWIGAGVRNSYRVK